MCICTSVFVSLCTFHMPPHLVFANLHSSPPCHRYCSSIAAGTQRTHRSVAEQQLAGHSCNIYFRLHKNLAQILHKYCIFINIHAQNCTIHAKIFLKYLNISPNGFISTVLCGGSPVQLRRTFVSQVVEILFQNINDVMMVHVTAIITMITRKMKDKYNC